MFPELNDQYSMYQMDGCRAYAVKSLFSISCLFHPDGYCIDTLWVMFSYIEKPFTVTDVTANDVAVVCDCDDKNGIIVQQYTTLYFITCSLIGHILRTPSR
jgi:hypothetical protein